MRQSRKLKYEEIEPSHAHMRSHFSSHGDRHPKKQRYFSPKFSGPSNFFYKFNPRSILNQVKYSQVKKRQINKKYQVDVNQKFLKEQPHIQEIQYLGYHQQKQRHFIGRQKQLYRMQTENERGISIPALNPDFSFPDPYVRYKIIPVRSSHMSLDIAQSNAQNFKRGQLIIWDHYGGPHQLFYIKPFSNKYFNFISSSTGFYMEVENNKSEIYESKVRERIVFRPKNEKESQKFKIRNYKKGIYYIQSYYGEVLDVEQEQIKNGAPVILWNLKYENNFNQLWMIKPN